MNKKKHKLSVSMSDDYCFIGISSDEPDYKLCWLINDLLGMSFIKTDNLKVFHKKLKEEQQFSMFQFNDDNVMLVYRIIENKSENGYFLSEVKNIDYFLHIQGDMTSDDLSVLVSKLNELPAVRMCVPLDLSRVKDRERLELW